MKPKMWKLDSKKSRTRVTSSQKAVQIKENHKGRKRNCPKREHPLDFGCLVVGRWAEKKLLQDSKILKIKKFHKNNKFSFLLLFYASFHQTSSFSSKHSQYFCFEKFFRTRLKNKKETKPGTQKLIKERKEKLQTKN